MVLRLLERAGIFIVSLVVSSMIVFAFMAILPGDPARVALGIGASDDAVAAMRTQFGLDQPLTSQYLQWAGGLARFDFGNSYISGAAIGPQISDRLAVTLWLVVTAMVIAVVVAVPMGAVMAVRRLRLTLM